MIMKKAHFNFQKTATLRKNKRYKKRNNFKKNFNEFFLIISVALISKKFYLMDSLLF